MFLALVIAIINTVFAVFGLWNISKAFPETRAAVVHGKKRTLLQHVVSRLVGFVKPIEEIKGRLDSANPLIWYNTLSILSTVSVLGLTLLTPIKQNSVVWIMPFSLPFWPQNLFSKTNVC